MNKINKISIWFNIWCIISCIFLVNTLTDSEDAVDELTTVNQIGLCFIESLEDSINTYKLENERLVDIEYDYVLKSSNLVHLFTTISKIESSEGLYTVGDNGRALGPLQIHIGCVNDVNKKYGTNYTHNDMFDMEKAMDVAAMYLNINAERYNNYYGNYPTIEALVRSFNGGYGGFTNDLTLEYGNKFTNYLNDV